MMKLRSILSGLLRDTRGTMTIETAFIVPILVVMAFGGFEASYMVARQSELRTAASEAVAMALSTEGGEAIDSGTIEDIIETSTGLDDDAVTIATKYRCDDADEYVDTKGECDVDAVVSGFLVITMDETYTPRWTQFGIGAPVDFTVERTVQIS